MRAEKPLELTILAHEGVKTLGQSAALRIQVLHQRRGHTLVHLRNARREQLPDLAHERAPGLANACGVNLTARGTHREDPDAKRGQRESLDVLCFAVTPELGDDLGVRHLEHEGHGRRNGPQFQGVDRPGSAEGPGGMFHGFSCSHV